MSKETRPQKPAISKLFIWISIIIVTYVLSKSNSIKEKSHEVTAEASSVFDRAKETINLVKELKKSGHLKFEDGSPKKELNDDVLIIKHLKSPNSQKQLQLFCSDEVVLQMQGFLDDGKKFFDSALLQNSILSFKVGDMSAPRALTKALVGKRIGDEIEFLAPASISFDDAIFKAAAGPAISIWQNVAEVPHNSKVRYRVKILPNASSITESSLEMFTKSFSSDFEVFVDGSTKGSSKTASCGDLVYADIKVKKLDGKVLFEHTDNKTNPVIISESINLPIGLGFVLSQATKGQKVKAILNHSMLKDHLFYKSQGKSSGNGNFSNKFNIGQGEAVVAEISIKDIIGR